MHADNMADENVRYDVRVVDAFKSYGGNRVINGLSMYVPSGSIYGLLGSSGCGKSTLLQCILGTMTLDSGSIELKANCLSDIGYMPQDLCLEDTLTLKEMFLYYGTLYAMTKKQIEKSTEKLTAFLQLPDMNKYIKNISGGQARRVSIAVSLLHDPKVIILDEPTVGIDPLLREEIWAEFSNMVKYHDKTIIITTHYIEEATKATCVGFMRNGVLIEEASPQYILNKYDTDSLESAFLALCCKRQENRIIHNDVPDVQDRQRTQAQFKSLTKPETSINSVRIKALLKKNLNVFSRDYLLLFTVLVLPIFQVFNLCFGVGSSINGMRIAVKSDETNLSDCHHTKINGCIFDDDNNQTMSCVMINYLASRDYSLVEVKDREMGEYMMNHHQTVAFLHFSQNYTNDLSNYGGSNRESYNSSSPVYVHYSKDNLLIKNQITTDLMASLNHLLQKTLHSCSNNPKALGIPMEFNTVIGKEVKSYLNSLVALFVAMGAFYFPSLFSVSLMLSERMDGILCRSMFAGVTVMELLISLFCITTVILLFQVVLTIFVAYVVFPNPILISSGLFMYFVVMIFLGFIGFFYGLLVAGLSTTKLGGVYVINGLSMSQFLLSGFVWPIEGQSWWLRSVSKFLPMRVAGNTMSDIALKGWTWNHPSVIYGTGMTIFQAFLLVVVLYGLGKLKKDMWVQNK